MSIKINFIQRKSSRERVWKTLNVVVGITTILNVSMVGALVRPGTASAQTAPDASVAPAAVYSTSGTFNLDLSQWRDKAPLSWIHGDLNSSKSAYHEGESVPFRLELTNMSAGDYTVRVRYDFQKGAKNAYDYLTTYNRSRAATAPGGSSVSTAIPSDPGLPFTQVPGSFMLWGGTFVGSAVGPSADPAHPEEKYYTVTVHTTGSDMFLLWGGHLASDVNWGAGNGASSISGAPFHMAASRYIGSTKSSSMDRSIQPGAVLPPLGSITVNKYDNQQNLLPGATFKVCPAGSTSNCTTTTDGQSPDGSANGIVLFSNLTTSIAGVSYDVTETVAPTGWFKDSATHTLTLTSVNPDQSTSFVNTPAVCTMTLTKSVQNLTHPNGPNVPGDTLNYTIVVTNDGTADCTGGGIKVQDVVDSQLGTPVDGARTHADLGYEFTSPPTPWWNSTTRTLTWNAHTLHAGESATINWSAPINVTECGDFTIKNKAKAIPAEIPGGVWSNEVTTTGTKICTGTIELRKIWSGTPGQTTLNIGTTAGAGDVDTQLTGANGAAPLTTGQNTEPAGMYYVSETGELTNYSPALACFNDVNNNGTNDGEPPVAVGAQNAVAVDAGQHVICTFTNTRDTARVTFDKVIVGGGPATDGNWAFAVDRVGSYHDGEGVTLDTNTSHAVTESSQYNDLYTLTGASGVCSLNQGNIVMNVGAQGGTCVVENTRNTGRLIVHKLLDQDGNPQTPPLEDPPGWTWDIQNGEHIAMGEGRTLITKSYTVTEDQHPNFTAGDWYCESNNQVVAQGAGEELTVNLTTDGAECWFTNMRDTGSLKVNKLLDADGNGSFETVNPEMFVWGLDPATPDRVMGSTLPGLLTSTTYDVNENHVGGYHFFGWSYGSPEQVNCTDPQYSELPASITVSKGGTTEITLCNARDTGSITVNKMVDPENDGTFVGVSGDATPFRWGVDTLDGTTTPRFMGSPATGLETLVAHSVKENDVSGYHPVGWFYNDHAAQTNYQEINCNHPEFTSLPAALTVEKGKTTEITICNARDTGTITVIKHVINNNGGIKTASDFTMNIGGVTLVSGSNTFAGSETGVSRDVLTGVYNVTETALPGYTVGYSADCAGAITLGQTKTCTITNDDIVSTIGLVKTAAPAVVSAGGNITYTLAWSVTGVNPVHGAFITDPIPANTTFVSASCGTTTGTCTIDSSTATIKWSLGTRNAGESGTVTLVVKTASPIINGTVVTNTGTFDTDETPPFPSTVNTPITSAPILSITKTNDVIGFTNPGKQVNYTITVTNASAATDVARNVVMNDTLPAGFTFADTGLVTKSTPIGDLAIGASQSFTFLVNISASQAAGVYTNTATAQGSNTLLVTATSNVDIRVPSVLGVSAEPNLVLTKTVDTTTTSPGKVVTYTVTISNTGDADLTNVVLTDKLPTGLTFLDSGKNSKTWTIGTLKANHQRVINYQVKFGATVKASSYTNTATVTSNELDPANAHATVVVKLPKVLGLASTGASARDYVIFALGVGLMSLGAYWVGRQHRQSDGAALA